MLILAGVILLMLFIVVPFFSRGGRVRMNRTPVRVAGAGKTKRRRRGPRLYRVSHRTARSIRRTGILTPARYCECGKLAAVCRRDTADAEHAEGMLGPRKKR
jgi:hypothetical protein